MRIYKTYNYHPFISNWLRLVEQKKVHACKEQKKLCEFLRSVLDNKNVYVDNEAVDEYVRITEKYFFGLMPDQKCYGALIVGLREKDTKQIVFKSNFNN